MSSPKLAASCRIRSTPYTKCVEALGVSGYSVVNHTILPKGFARSVEEDYWHLREQVQLWDVSCQRQVELKGPDAAYLAQLMAPRNLGNTDIGQCLYAPVMDENAGMLNDPVILKLGEGHYWFSISDSDLLLWAKGLQVGLGLDVIVNEPDVSPLAVQGLRADDLMETVFGPAIREIGFFRFQSMNFQGRPLIIARSGFSRQGGFEIYLNDSTLGETLWTTLWEAGRIFDVAPGCPNLIERIEGGLLSYGNEMTRMNNPLECGLGKFCQADGSIDFIGLEALRKINEQGPERLIRGVIFHGGPCPACSNPWPVMIDGKQVGRVTSAIWSPRFKANVALGMIEKGYWQSGREVIVYCEDGVAREGEITDLPMKML